MIFIFPTELEAQKFRIACPCATIVICGVGMAQCAAVTASIIAQLRAEGKIEKLVLAGIAGSYSLDDVALCEVVEVVSEEIAALPARFRERYISEPQTTLRAVASNSVNIGGDAQTNAQIENMEGAAFMALCQKLRIEAMQIRAVSNRVGDPFAAWRVEEACEALSEGLRALL